MAEGGKSLPEVPSVETRENCSSEGDKCVSEGDSELSNMDSIDILLQRTKSERQNELRQIQCDNRPVTGQSNRDNIGQFLSKAFQVRETAQAAQATGKENVPLNTPNVEEHRPEAVIVEIEGLSQQQRVSSVLQTAAFRRHLENIIRGNIGVRSRSPAVSQRQPQSREQTPNVSTPPRVPTPVDRVPTPVERVATSDVTDSRRGSTSSESTQNSVDYMLRIQDPRGLLSQHLNNGHIPPPPPLPVPDNDRPEPQPVTWNVVSDIHRETIVQEISELVHQHLVTTTLDGGFRNVLEFHLRERVSQTGADGQRVQEYIQSIPQTRPHIPNDFSELGLPPPNLEDNWDNVSVTSVRTSTVPYSQTNLYMSRELAALKAQMQEMKNMMKVSFDLQLDIQRAIRQEVAAGLAAAMASNGANQAEASTLPATTQVPRRSVPVSDTHCLICLDNFSDSVLYQCGHMCVCFPCGRHLMDRGSKCPVCRAPIRDVIRAYKCNED